MTIFIAVLKEFAGLFIEDGALALAILAVVVGAAICAYVIPNAAPVTGAILLFGCLGVLVSNVIRACR